MAFPTLPPIPAPRAERVSVFGDQYVLDYDTVLIFQSPHFKISDSWKITDLDGQLVFKTADKIFELRDKKTLLNSNNEPICTMVEKLLTLHSTINAYPRAEKDGSPMFTAKVPMLTNFPKIDVFMGGNSSDDPDYVLYGNFDKIEFKVYSRTRNVLADVKWDCFSHHRMHTVSIKIPAGMDIAFAIMLVQMAMELTQK